jgi:hypothetical protein
MFAELEPQKCPACQKLVPFHKKAQHFYDCRMLQLHEQLEAKNKRYRKLKR